MNPSLLPAHGSHSLSSHGLLVPLAVCIFSWEGQSSGGPGRLDSTLNFKKWVPRIFKSLSISCQQGKKVDTEGKNTGQETNRHQPEHFL